MAPQTTNDPPMIQVDHLTKRYPNGRVAVNDISFQVHAGEVLGFVGPNGAGKTTTMKILTTFLAPTSGSAKVAGFDVYEQGIEARRRIGYLPEDTPLYRDMSVLEYLEWVARVRKLPASEVRPRLKRVTEQCAIGDRLGSLIGELSKGFRQRVGLAQAILHDPDVLILDEPTSGLDPNQIVEIRNVIKEFGKTRTVIFSTHILPEVKATCSRVLVISDGRLVADASPTELSSILEKARGMELVVDFGDKAESMAAAVEKIAGVTSVRPYVELGEARSAGRLLVGARPGTDLRAELFRLAAANAVPLLEVARHAPLEDVFRHLTMGGDGKPRAAATQSE